MQADRHTDRQTRKRLCTAASWAVINGNNPAAGVQGDGREKGAAPAVTPLSQRGSGCHVVRSRLSSSHTARFCYGRPGRHMEHLQNRSESVNFRAGSVRSGVFTYYRKSLHTEPLKRCEFLTSLLLLDLCTSGRSDDCKYMECSI